MLNSHINRGQTWKGKSGSFDQTKCKYATFSFS
uniref:Uncharacterized protein n=1 Tax=Nelumbo nucifera TaxID=4432 RepID=A0A822ZSD3_NELNU|nr:TPA_asm: hypothetical protein HUJ06_004546 [Nelumbo nucifera]